MPVVPLSSVAVHLRPQDNIAVAARHLQPDLELRFSPPYEGGVGGVP